jgi:hypothetical protein
MTMVERVGEGLARRLNRRQAVKRAAAAVFGMIAAWTVEGIRAPGALASHCALVSTGDCTCDPAYGIYCKRLNESYCAGSACAGGCYYDETFWPGACWCSAICQYSSQYGTPLIGYYQCCDCNCYGQQCACRQFLQTG